MLTAVTGLMALSAKAVLLTYESTNLTAPLVLTKEVGPVVPGMYFISPGKSGTDATPGERPGGGAQIRAGDGQLVVSIAIHPDDIETCLSR